MSVATPPQNLEAEESVLGAMLLSGGACDAVAEILQPEDFYRQESHGAIYSAAVALHMRGVPVDVLTLSDELEKLGQLNQVGGKSRVHELAALVPSSGNAGHYARMVRDASIHRGLLRAGQEIARLGQDREGEVEILLGRAEDALTAVTQSGHDTAVYPLADAADRMVTRIRQAYQAGEAMFGLRTGFTDIDNALLGFWGGQLVIVAARPGQGKSTLALNIAENIADRAEAGLLVSLEMSGDELAVRSLSRAAEVDSLRLTTGLITEDEAKKLSPGIEVVLARRPYLLVEDGGGMTVQRLGAIAARLKRTHDIKYMIVDYIQLMSPPKAENRNVEISIISRGLKQLAMKMDIPVIALSQMSRDIEKRANPRPMLADLRDSGSLEQDADVVIFLHDDSNYDPDKEPDGETEVIFAKARRGALKPSTKILYTRRYSKFHDLKGRRETA